VIEWHADDAAVLRHVHGLIAARPVDEVIVDRELAYEWVSGKKGEAVRGEGERDDPEAGYVEHAVAQAIEDERYRSAEAWSIGGMTTVFAA
jgi:hypothetical protein